MGTLRSILLQIDCLLLHLVFKALECLVKGIDRIICLVGKFACRLTDVIEHLLFDYGG